jgi:hypothetical protein
MSAINDSGSLFEVNVPEFKLLRQCRRELKMLKVCWCHWLLCGHVVMCGHVTHGHVTNGYE